MKKTKIIISDPLGEVTEKLLESLGRVVRVYTKDKQKRLLEEIADAETICVRTATHVGKELIDKAPKLKYILTFTMGTDHIDVAYARVKGVEVIEDRLGGTKDSVAEHTVGLMIDLVRKISYSDRKMRQNAWAKRECMSIELKGKTLGIIGCGRIGTRVAEIAKLGLGMRVMGYDPYVKSDLVRMVSLEELLAESDVITLHVPKTDETTRMIGKKEFDTMARGKKPYIINTARGTVIDMNELYAALKEGKIKGAALDVYPKEPPFGDAAFQKIFQKIRQLSNVVLTPHTAGSTLEGKIKTGENVIRRFMA